VSPPPKSIKLGSFAPFLHETKRHAGRRGGGRRKEENGKRGEEEGGEWKGSERERGEEEEPFPYTHVLRNAKRKIPYRFATFNAARLKSIPNVCFFSKYFFIYIHITNLI